MLKIFIYPHLPLLTSSANMVEENIEFDPDASVAKMTVLDFYPATINLTFNCV